jgi:hypothetical protein
MDANALQEEVGRSKGVPTASLLKQIDQGIVSGTLEKGSLADFLKVVNSRPPIVFPEVETVPFEYTPLPTATSIRLLRIGPEDEDGLLRCFLDTVDLNDEPLFNCLSYTWVWCRWCYFTVC